VYFLRLRRQKNHLTVMNNTQTFSYWHLAIFLGAVDEGGFNLTICKNFFENQVENAASTIKL